MPVSSRLCMDCDEELDDCVCRNDDDDAYFGSDVVCSDCGIRTPRGLVGPTCQRCSRPPCCCTCASCAGCGMRRVTQEVAVTLTCPTGCGVFTQGERSCRCVCVCTLEQKKPPFKFHQYPLSFKEANRKEFQNNPLKRFLGAEIEVAKATDFGIIMDVCGATETSTVYDGSLPKNRGFELTTQPANGDKWGDNLETVCEALKVAGAEIDGSCGVHVHADCRDITNLELIKIIRVYCHLEPALFSIIPPARRLPNSSTGNWYTTPFIDRGIYILQGLSPSDKNAIQSKIYKIYGANGSNGDKRRFKERLDNYKKKKYNDNRYYGFNLHSFYHRGTLESRMHEGSLDSEAIANWGMAFGHLIEWAKNANYSEVAALPLYSYSEFASKYRGSISCIHQWSDNPQSWETLKRVLQKPPKLLEYFEARRASFSVKKTPEAVKKTLKSLYERTDSSSVESLYLERMQECGDDMIRRMAETYMFTNSTPFFTTTTS